MAFAAAVPLFYRDVENIAWDCLYLGVLLLELVALVHCALQRKDAFTVIGSIPKGGWLGITAGSLLVTLLFFRSIFSFIAFIAITAAVFYMLEVRAGLKDVTGGSSGRSR